MSIIQTIQNQQSVVRTDFTLKYYLLDELLQKSSLLKIVGSNSQVFVRSWLDFSLVRGDLIIPWLSGDLSVVLKTLSHVLKQFIANIAGLVAFIKASESGTKLTFAVNIAQVNHSDFTILVNALKNTHNQRDDTRNTSQAENSLQNGRVKIEQLDTDESALQAQKTTQRTESNSYCASVVIWHPQNQLASSEYKHWSSTFSVILDVGQTKNAQINQALPQQAFGLTKAIYLKSPTLQKKLIPVTVSVFFVTVLSGWFYLDSNTGAPNPTQQIKTLLPTVDTQAENSLVILQATHLASQAASNFNRLKIAEDDPILPDEIVLNKRLEPQNLSSVISDSFELSSPQAVNENKEIPKPLDVSPTLLPPVISSTTAEITVHKKNSLKAAALNSIEISSPLAEMTFKHNILPDAASSNKETVVADLETISIIEVYSAAAINVGSSLNTSPKSLKNLALMTESAANDQAVRDSQLIENQVDTLLSAWQTKDFLSYSQVYSKDFKGDRSSHQSWMNWRKQRIEKPKWVKLSRSDIKYLRLPGEQHVITFTLSYASPNYEDDTLKRITFARTATSFKIIREENLKVLRLR